MARRAGRSPTRAGPDSDEPGECFGKTRAFAASVAADVAGRLHCDQLLGLHAASPLCRLCDMASPLSKASPLFQAVVSSRCRRLRCRGTAAVNMVNKDLNMVKHRRLLASIESHPLQVASLSGHRDAVAACASQVLTTLRRRRRADEKATSALQHFSRRVRRRRARGAHVTPPPRL